MNTRCPDDYLIRPMRPEDLDEVVALEEVCFQDPWPRSAFLPEVEERRGNFSHVVRHEDGDLAAFMVAWVVGDEAHLGDIAVSPDHRGKKLGQVLVELLKEGGWMSGAVQVVLEVRVSNDSAIQLYEKLGFRKVAIRKAYYADDGEDALIMICSIEGGTDNPSTPVESPMHPA